MAILIQKLRKSFDGKEVLRDFSAEIEEGAVTCVMGPSGGGKTTLLRILMGLLPADGGSISSLAEKRFSAVFQEDRLCENISAPANLRLVCGKAVPREDIHKALRDIGLGESLQGPVREFSGGMKRRVALARALVVPFDMLFLDEPFKGLDAENRERALEYLRASIRGKTVVMVTHDPEEAKMLNARVIMLDRSDS